MRIDVLSPVEAARLTLEHDEILALRQAGIYKRMHRIIGRSVPSGKGHPLELITVYFHQCKRIALGDDQMPPIKRYKALCLHFAEGMIRTTGAKFTEVATIKIDFEFYAAHRNNLPEGWGSKFFSAVGVDSDAELPALRRLDIWFGQQ